jgi:hypothetical protein
MDLAAHNVEDVSPVTYVGNRLKHVLEPHAKLTGLFIMRYSLHMEQFPPLLILHSSNLITIHTSGQVASTAPVLARVTGYHVLGITVVTTCTRQCICVKELAISGKAAERSDGQCLSSSLNDVRWLPIPCIYLPWIGFLSYIVVSFGRQGGHLRGVEPWRTFAFGVRRILINQKVDIVVDPVK